MSKTIRLNPSLSYTIKVLLTRIFPVLLCFGCGYYVINAYRNEFFDGLLKIKRIQNVTIVIVTPTYKRNERLADMIRLSQTLSQVRNLHWIVIEDGNQTSPAVRRILYRSGVPHVYLATVSDPGMPKRGWTHRNLALQYVRENYSIKHKAVLYFADDDNSYDLRLFDKYIRKIKRIGIWAVGLVGGALVEAPKVNSKGIISGWDVIFAPNRPFATDMAGFAINIKELFRVNASFNSNCAKIYKEGPESCFLSQFKIKKEQLEPFGYNDNPKEVLVWHTKTVKATAKGQKHGYAVE